MRDPAAVLAVIGEVEAAVRVEHEVVRADELVAVALGVEHLDVAAVEVDALDAAAAVVGGQLAPRESAMPTRSRKSQPPLLQTYSAPSGPIASPFGLPPGSATVSFVPSGCTRVTHAALQLDDEHAAVGHRRPDLRETRGRR